MAITTEDESLRTEAIDLLVDYAIQDLAYSLRDYYNEHLLKFSPQHFSTKSKETIKSLLNNKEYLSRDLILLIGHLNLIESTNDLEQLLNPIEIFRNRGPRYFKTIDFSARLVLAKFGDERQLDFVVKRLEGEQDYVFLISSGLQYYSYLKQPKATRLLMRYFKKDILLHPFSDELYYISDYAFVELKKIIKGLPKKKVAARRWLNNRNFEKLKYK